MLSKITIQNFALIQHLSVSLENGLQVITGETGAGKSIILGALRLILGERADLKSLLLIFLFLRKTTLILRKTPSSEEKSCPAGNPELSSMIFP